MSHQVVNNGSPAEIWGKMKSIIGRYSPVTFGNTFHSNITWWYILNLYLYFHLKKCSQFDWNKQLLPSQSILSASCTSWVFFFFLSLALLGHASTPSLKSGHPRTAKFFVLLTGWRRRNPSGRRCGPWRDQRPPSSRHGGCTGTHWGCSAVGCRPGSWGHCEHCQDKQMTYKNMCMISGASFTHWRVRGTLFSFLKNEKKNHFY